MIINREQCLHMPCWFCSLPAERINQQEGFTVCVIPISASRGMVTRRLCADCTWIALQQDLLRQLPPKPLM